MATREFSSGSSLCCLTAYRNGTIMEPHTAPKIILPHNRFSPIIHRDWGYFCQQSVEPVYPDIKL